MSERMGIRDDFMAAVRDEVRAAEEKLGGGSAKDWASYQAAVAQIAAYKRCAKLLDSIYRDYLRDDDDDDER